jgi:hypothetical protein
MLHTDDNTYHEPFAGWAIQTINGEIYYTAIDSGHGGREYRIKVGKHALDYAKSNKPTSGEMDVFLQKNGYTKVEWCD